MTWAQKQKALALIYRDLAFDDHTNRIRREWDERRARRATADRFVEAMIRDAFRI